MMVPLVFAGILLRPSLQPRLVGRRLLLIDTLLAMAGLIAVAWVLVLGPMYELLGTDPLVQIITFAYPAGDVAILCCLVIAVLREADYRPGTWPLLAGLALMAIADAAYAVLVIQGAYSTGHPIDVVWFASLAVIGLAATLERTVDGPSLRRLMPPISGASWRFMTPTVLLALATVLVWSVSMQRGVTPGGVAEGCARGGLAAAAGAGLARVPARRREPAAASDSCGLVTPPRSAASSSAAASLRPSAMSPPS